MHESYDIASFAWNFQYFNSSDAVSKHLSLATCILKVVSDIHRESFDSMPNLSCKAI
jgi:hypothetical protein